MHELKTKWQRVGGKKDITRAFVTHCDEDLPQHGGIAFVDGCVGADWQPVEKAPETTSTGRLATR